MNELWFEWRIGIYMTKPFGILELQARVRSLLRRHVTSDIIRTKHLTVDKQTRLVSECQK